MFQKKSIVIKKTFEKERVREDFNILCQNLEDIYSLISPDKNNIFIIKEGKNYYPIVLVKKLDESDKNDRLIINMLDDVKQNVGKRLDSLETRVNDLATFRWIATGIGTAAVLVIGSAQFFGNILLTPQHQPATIERTK